MNQLQKLTTRVQEVRDRYKKEFPEIRMDRDYLPLKLSEEWGECMQAYLMLSDRGRQKGKTKAQMRVALREELADVFGYLLLFAAHEKVDLDEALEKKWFAYLKK